MSVVDKDRPSSWVKYRESLCRGCRAECCAMLLEVTVDDLIRIGVCDADEAARSLKKLFKRLRRDGIAASYRDGTRLFMLRPKANGDCQFLDSTTRLCTIYDRRPQVCRAFPSIGPRPGWCPSRPRSSA